MHMRGPSYQPDRHINHQLRTHTFSLCLLFTEATYSYYGSHLQDFVSASGSSQERNRNVWCKVSSLMQATASSTFIANSSMPWQMNNTGLHGKGPWQWNRKKLAAVEAQIYIKRSFPDWSCKENPMICFCDQQSLSNRAAGAIPSRYLTESHPSPAKLHCFNLSMSSIMSNSGIILQALGNRDWEIITWRVNISWWCDSSVDVHGIAKAGLRSPLWR